MFNKILFGYQKQVYGDGIRLDEEDVAKMNEIKSIEATFEKRKNEYFQNVVKKYKLKGDNFYTIEPKNDGEKTFFYLKAVKREPQKNATGIPNIQAEEKPKD